MKIYDRLVLVGDADPRFTAAYSDPTSPYVLFDLPYKTAVKLAGGVNPGGLSKIWVTTNPRTVRSSRASTLFENFQVCTAVLQRRYRGF